MRWTVRVESIKKADIINDETIVLRDNRGDDVPPRMIGNKAGNLDVREVHIHVKRTVLPRLLLRHNAVQGYGTFAITGKEPGVEPRWSRIDVCFRVLATVVVLTGLSRLQLLLQSPAEKRPDNCPLRALGNNHGVSSRDRLVEFVHPTADNRLVQEMRKAREPFSPPGLNEGRLLDADTLKELWRTDNAFAEGPNVDKKISALTTSFKSDTHRS